MFKTLKMVDDYLILIVPALIGAIVATISNYIYYKQTTHKENKAKFLKEQITELLQPLYFTIYNIDLENYDEHTDTFREDEEAFVKILLEEQEIEKITINKLYLASKEVSSLLLRFHDIQYVSEFGEGYSNDYVLEQYDKLRKTIYKEFNEKVRLYQENY